MIESLRRLHWSIYSLALASGVIMTGFMMLLPLLPGYAQQLGFSEYDVGLLVAAFFIGRVLFQFPLGVLSDRVGRRGIMSASLLLFTITTAAYALTTESMLMMALRLGQGIASSGFAVGSQAYINDRTPIEFRGLANGVVSSAINIGVIAGPVLGGTLSQVYDMQAPFWVGGALGGLCFLISLAIPRERIKKLTSARGNYMSITAQLRQMLSKVLCLPSFSLSIIHLLVMMALAIFLTSAPILTAEILGWSGKEIAFAFAIGGAAATISSPFLGRLSDRIGRIWVIAIGLAALSFQGLIVFLHPGAPLMIVAFALGGAGTPAYFNGFYSLIGDVTTPGERGAITGFIGSFGEWGSIIGSSLIVPFAWRSISIRAPMAIDVMISMLTLLLAVSVRGKFQRRIGEQQP